LKARAPFGVIGAPLGEAIHGRTMRLPDGFTSFDKTTRKLMYHSDRRV